MARRLKITYASLDASLEPVVVLFCDADLQFPPIVGLGPGYPDRLRELAQAEQFKGKSASALDLIAPTDITAQRVLVVGLGGGAAKREAGSTPNGELNPLTLGGQIEGRLPKGRAVSIVAVRPDGTPLSATETADLGLGLQLAHYSFDKYKSKKDKDEGDPDPRAIVIHAADATTVRRSAKAREALAEGVALARDLVNEPPNVLTPEEFAERAGDLDKLGVEVEILDDKQLKKIGMRALLGVGQGSARGSRVVIMRWLGAKDEKKKPLAFIGKGVTFDTGGISIKPAQGMEDMKGDMAGAAAVVGLMHALASRGAKVNAIGAIGLVENMPGENAQRPGDIVTSLSGQTIEIINTDAEGRLVLADVLWYVQDKYRPEFMIDLATLTGAILTALGQEHAGLFSNDDELATRLAAAGGATGEKVWRLPLGKEYDKLIDSKFADMKNTGGRNGGSITAAQFLQRFVNETAWAHLDIAGTAMASPASDINKSWGSGWGVRLLDRLVADHYER